jgi:hypothetical protein
MWGLFLRYNVLKLPLVMLKLHDYSECHWIVHFKCKIHMECDVYLSKAVHIKKERKRRQVSHWAFLLQSYHLSLCHLTVRFEQVLYRVSYALLGLFLNFKYIKILNTMFPHIRLQAPRKPKMSHKSLYPEGSAQPGSSCHFFYF